MSKKGFEIDLQTVRSGFDGKTCYVNPWAGVWPGGDDVVMTMQKLLLSGSDVFYGAMAAYSHDRGASFSPFEPIDVMARREEGGNRQSCVNDLKPQWHAQSGAMLGIGVRVYYKSDDKPAHVGDGHPPETVFSTCDRQNRLWSAPDLVEMGSELSAYSHIVAGSVQRLHKEDGSILMPLSCKPDDTRARDTIVGEFEFDGEDMRLLRRGNALSVPVERGLYEPSLIRTGGRYYMTMRNDNAGYVSVSDDGLHFSEPEPWKFDDGEELGNYNTQQHWLTHNGRAWLIYTRRGLNNDHVFRHRAPLLVAEVDIENQVVFRETEQVLVPERGARLGNFGVTEVDETESWVTAAEWMQPLGCEQYGSDNSVYLGRVRLC